MWQQMLGIWQKEIFTEKMNKIELLFSKNWQSSKREKYK